MKISKKELAERLGVEYAAAAGLVAILEAKGLASVVEKRPNPTGKGKPTDIFEIPETVTLELGEINVAQSA